ncbi:hypothetical protein HU200_018786 [Digitaria exilis]|uniref:Uncharacterized protein n=1 Tax=Digitaria exilis TaxID=1010633 RepID=A0A835F4F9_9POAL|nr:hypothetical protein HU200_018786 [Digitaria exilis]
MAVLPSYCVEEELAYLKSLVEAESEADDMLGMEEEFRALLCKVSELERVEAPSLSDELAWAESLEASVKEAADAIADEAEAIHRAVAVLALRPGEEATVVALRRRAALASARRAEAEELAAAARRLQEKNLRSLAAKDDEHLLDDAMGGPSMLGGGGACCVATPEEMAELERACVRMEERMAWLAGSLRRGAVAFAAARPGEEEAALVAGKLEGHAASADAARGTVVAFAASVRRLRDTTTTP